MNNLPSLATIEAAAEVVYAVFPPTPQYSWPLLNQRLGTKLVVKHENHTPVGAFKIRGGLVFFDNLAKANKLPKQVFSATRGNHGQSIGLAAQMHGVQCTIVVPEGNSEEKNNAMRALGVNLIEFGTDFVGCVEHARHLAEEARRQAANPDDVLMVPSFHEDLVAGVATYWYELLQAHPETDVLYAPIGLGSGAVAAIAAKQALNHPAEIVGVVSSLAPSYAVSLEQGELVEVPATTFLVDGMAVRKGHPEALAIFKEGLARVVRVTDEEVAAAMRAYYTDTHNAVEGAGAAALAAALQERELLAGKTVGVPITGGNVDAAVFADVLLGR